MHFFASFIAVVVVTHLWLGIYLLDLFGSIYQKQINAANFSNKQFFCIVNQMRSMIIETK